MPLFKCTIEIKSTAEIAVEASSEEEARAYLSRTDEWKEDGAINEVKNAKLDVEDVKRVVHPSEMPDFESDTLVWNQRSSVQVDVTITHAFFELPLIPPGECSDDELYDFDDAVEEKKKEWDRLRDAKKT